MTLADPSDINVVSLTDTGRVRKHNEDSVDEFERTDGMRLLVVADGMGGHRGGATASKLAVETIGEVFATSELDPEALLIEAIERANDRVYNTALEDPELRGMGTTAVMLLIGHQGHGWIAHVGDSRGYRVREGQIEPLTDDHSVVGEMVRRGLIAPEEANTHPRRNEILRSVGVEATVEPELLQIDLRPGDRYLLCSDGLSGLVSDQEIAAVTLREPPQRAAETLIASANARGGSDNITVQIAAFPGGLETASSTAPQPAAWMEKDSFQKDGATRLKTLALGLTGLSILLVVVMLWFLYTNQGSRAETAVPDSGQPVPVEAAPVNAGPVAVAPADARPGNEQLEERAPEPVAVPPTGVEN